MKYVLVEPAKRIEMSQLEICTKFERNYAEKLTSFIPKSEAGKVQAAATSQTQHTHLKLNF
jgi:hypothetical protein